MKKILFLCLLAGVFVSNAQTPTQIVNGPGSTYVYIGSLNRGSDNSANSQKIVVKVLGGSWFGDSDGETTFYISNRGGLTINETSMGSNTAHYVAFKAYQNGENIDFYLVPSANDYTSFAVTSYSFGFALTPQFVTITTQSAAPQLTDITPSITITSVMITDASGNIGMGTASPDAKLAVNGTIHSKEVKVDMNILPDYVFQPKYDLPSLKAIKTYVEQHQHLPGVPSAQQVAKEGLNLGEMNAILLKKVEELTLYLIEKDKELKEQQSQMTAQQSALKNQEEKLEGTELQFKQQAERINQLVQKLENYLNHKN